jgi:hypothetical protein
VLTALATYFYIVHAASYGRGYLPFPNAVVAILGTSFFVTLMVLSTGYLGRLFTGLVHRLGLQLAQIVVCIGIVGIGVGAHFFKKKYQFWYGVVEVCFAVATAINIAGRLSPGQQLLSQWTALAGCAYVVARGLNNIAESKAKL